MDEIRTIAVPVTTAGEAASAVGSATSEALYGMLLDIRLDFHASAPATTDTTVAYAAFYDKEGDSIPTFGNILVVANVNTDGTYAPRQDYCDDAGAVMGQQPHFPLNGPLTVSVAGADALTNCVIAYIRYIGW